MGPVQGWLGLLMVVAVLVAVVCSLATSEGRRPAAVIPSCLMAFAMVDSIAGVFPRAIVALLLVVVPVVVVAVHRRDRVVIESLAHRALLSILTAGFLLNGDAMLQGGTLPRTTGAHHAMLAVAAPMTQALLVGGTVVCVAYCVRGLVVLVRSDGPFRRRRAGELGLMTAAMVAMVGMGLVN
jgi:hypothetical protein